MHQNDPAFREVTCDRCKGEGWPEHGQPDEHLVCSKCRGSGVVQPHELDEEEPWDVEAAWEDRHD